MISSFFRKTKPINYIVLVVFLFLLYGVFLFFGPVNGVPMESFSTKGLIMGALLFSIYGIIRMVKVDKVTGLNTFALLFFILLLMVFPNILQNKNVIFTNLFLLLAIWRLLGIKSIGNVKHKIFDASFLICVASFFYDWALLFLILVFVMINVYDRKATKNWLVPFVAIATVVIVSFTILRLYGVSDFYIKHYQFSIDFLSNNFFGKDITIKLLVYISLILMVMFFVFLKVRKKGGGKLLLLRIIFLVFVLGATISFLRFNDPSAVLMTFFPAAVFLTNFLENIKKNKLRELVVISGLLVSFLLFVLELNL